MFNYILKQNTNKKLYFNANKKANLAKLTSINCNIYFTDKLKTK